MVILTEEDITSSSSTATPRWKHDVFLSFRGVDTRKNFTDHLYAALEQKGINTFRDDERPERGKPISLELLKAIEESRFAVIVLSRNYANSTWCLDELVKIVECMKKTQLIVLPVFYGVDPSDVCHQKGTFEQAFDKHKKRFNEKNIENVERWRSALREVVNFFMSFCRCLFYHVDHSDMHNERETSSNALSKREDSESIDKVKMWRAALREVTNLSGWHLGERHESKVIREIVAKIFKKLHDMFPIVTKGLVGIEHQLKILEQLLHIGSADVLVIGIWGMGGIGKTTLAKVVYDIYSIDFEGCSFIKNVTDFSKESDFVQLQQQLLHEILKEENIRIWNVESGVDVIKKRLRCKNILLVLDDVNHLNQLKYLAKERDWFGSGSRIIITTRDQHLLNAYKVDGKHKCKELNHHDALKLFCLKAFEKEKPKEGYEQISQKIVDYADGLPLALDVLGSLLVDRTINHWKDVLKRAEHDIFKTLEISYDGLNNEAEKRIFIYIACFLKGMNQDLVIDILESFSLYPESGMDVLIKRSLITISEDNIVQMHDLLQEMGWEIIRKQSPAKPSNCKGLKLHKDIFDVLTSNEGTKAIEIINEESSMEEVENCTCSPEAFSKIKKLGFLRISNVDFPQGIEYLSNELRILEWYKYPLKSLPSNFQSNELRELNMRYSQIEKLWEGAMVFPNLRFIDLSHSENLTQTPDLTKTTKLEALDLRGCTNLFKGHPSLLVHKRLKYLNMAGCTSLENLPSKIEMESLETLIFSNCSKVKRIPEFGENMKSLKELYLDGTAIEEIPPSIKHTSLQYIDFSKCSKLGKPLEKLGEIVCLENFDASKTAITKMHTSIAPMSSLRSLEHLCCLRQLKLSWCNLFAIPNSIGSLLSLRLLDLDGNNFVMLPGSISQLSYLFVLLLNGCQRLQSLPKLPSSLHELEAEGCTSLEKLPDISELGNWGRTKSWFISLAYSKLVENKNIGVVILKHHLQGCYGRKAPFAMRNRGNFLQWFTHQDVGDSVSIKLPPNWCDTTWLGFALCVHFNGIGPNYHETSTIVSAFAFLPDKQCICPPMRLCLQSHECNQVVWYVPRYDESFLYKDRKAFELLKNIDWNQCSGTIVFYFEAERDDNEFDYFEMKCGVRLVYEQDVEDLMQTTFQASGSSIPPGVVERWKEPYRYVLPE